MQHVRRAAVAVAVALTGSIALATGAAASAPPPRDIADACPSGIPQDQFSDVSSSSPHRLAIDCIVAYGITSGTSAGHYSPSLQVSRGQVASFLARIVEQTGGTLPAGAPDAFDDDNGNTHEANINRLAAAGVISGTGPRTFSPSQSITRGQMATFIARIHQTRSGSALPPATEDYFSDDAGSAHEDSINRVAAQGIAAGTSGSLFSPNGPVLRDQMASFIARLLDKLVEDGVVDPPSQSAYLGSCNGGLASISTPSYWSCDQQSVNGTPFVRVLRNATCDDCSTDSIEFDLSRDFTHFTSTIGIGDTSEAGSQALFEVIADGQTVFSRTLGLGESVPVDVSVTNALRLRLQVTPINVVGQELRIYAVFGEPIVTS